MKEIIISSTKKIGSNSQNYIYLVKIKTKSGEEEWKKKWFYSSLRACYNDLLEHFTRDKDKATLKENLEETVKMLKVLEIRVKAGADPEL